MSLDRRVVVVRHGETSWSRSGRHTGRSDLQLTDRGEDRARRLRRWLEPEPFRLVVTSPLRRARRTCELAAPDGAALIDPDLVEWDYGEYEGLTSAQIERRNPGWELFRDGCPGGEGPDQVTARLDRVLARLRECEGDVAVFAHGHLLRAFAARWMGYPVTVGRHLALDTAAVGELGCHRGIPVIRRWNLTIREGPC